MSDFTIDDFISFMDYYLKLHHLELTNEPPQVTTYNKTDEILKIEFPHMVLDEETFPTWNLEIRKLLEESPNCDGFLCWMVLAVEGEDEEDEVDRVLFTTYNKESNRLVSYLSSEGMYDFEEVSLEDVMINLLDEYGSELTYH